MADLGRHNGPEVRLMKVKKAGFLTKVVVLALLIYLATSLLNIRAQLQQIREETQITQTQLAQENQRAAELNDAIQNKDDPAVLEAVARDKGFVKAGEKLFVDIAH